MNIDYVVTEFMGETVQRLGIVGRMVHCENGVQLNVVEYSILLDHEKAGWVTAAILSPLRPDGLSDGTHTCITFGDDNHTPWPDLLPAWAFCVALARNFDNKNVEEKAISILTEARGIAAVQWRDAAPVPEAPEEVVPAARVLH